MYSYSYKQINKQLNKQSMYVCVSVAIPGGARPFAARNVARKAQPEEDDSNSRRPKDSLLDQRTRCFGCRVKTARVGPGSLGVCVQINIYIYIYIYIYSWKPRRARPP